MSIGEPTQEAATRARARAEVDGLEVIESGPDLLLLDLDTWEARARMLYMLPCLKKHFGGATIVDSYRSRSGKGWHYVIRLGVDLEPVERIALQAALGSDGFRELLSIASVQNGVEHPSMLFKPPAVPEGVPF